MRRADLRGGKGAFTLLEIALSTAILGGVIASLLLARARCQEALTAASEMTTCARLCASRAAELRAGLIGAGEGDFGRPRGYRWRIAREGLAEGFPEGLSAYRVEALAPDGLPETGAAATVWLAAPPDAPKGNP